MTTRSLGSKVQCDACDQEVVVASEAPDDLKNLNGWWQFTASACAATESVHAVGKSVYAHVCAGCAKRPLSTLIEVIQARRDI